MNLIFDLVNGSSSEFGREVTKFIDVVKWRGAKKKLPAGRNSIQEGPNFRNAAVLSFIDDRDRIGLLLFLSVFEKRSQLFDWDKSDSGVVQAEPVQIAPESRKEIDSRRHECRLS